MARLLGNDIILNFGCQGGRENYEKEWAGINSLGHGVLAKTIMADGLHSTAAGYEI
jgi:hypothetical protein